MSTAKKVFEEIQHISDIVPVDYQNKIINFIRGENHFPWYTIDKISHNDYFKDGEPTYVDQKVSDHGGLYHMLYDEDKIKSDNLTLFKPILDSYCNIFEKTIQDVYRIRMRYTHPVPHHSKENYAAPHVDCHSAVPFTTLIYYINDSDGDTILFSKLHKVGIDEYDPIITEELTEVYRHTPKKGEAIVFNGHRYHAGNYPIEYSKRIVVNFDFIERENEE